MNGHISVVIPTYKAVAFLSATLDSVFAQTVPPSEVIVADDASTDGTPELVESIAATAPVPVRLLRSDRNSGGPAAPLNRGIAAARGGLIATLDHDDLMMPTRLERQAECWFADPSIGLVFGRCTRRQESGPESAVVEWARRAIEAMRRHNLGRDCYRIPAEEACKGVVSGCFALTCSNFLFPKVAWRACGGFDERLKASCDYGLLGSVSARFDLGFVDEVLTNWRPESNSLYQMTKAWARSDERLIVLKRLAREVRSTELGLQIRRAVRTEHLGIAYLAREDGDYLGASRRYLSSLSCGGPSREAILGLIKLAPHRLLRGRPKALGYSR